MGCGYLSATTQLLKLPDFLFYIDFSPGYYLLSQQSLKTQLAKIRCP